MARFCGSWFNGTALPAPQESLACRQGPIGAFVDYGIGYSMPKFVADTLNALLAFFTGYQIERVVTIVYSKPLPFFSKHTRIPPGCSTPAKGRR
jgi:hypothetical protein